jgi:hypothetical protein
VTGVYRAYRPVDACSVNVCYRVCVSLRVVRLKSDKRC